MILAAVASLAAHHRGTGGTGAKSIVTVPHAVAWRVAFGTGAVGFLKSAVYGLRAIENPARAVALLTEMIAFQASRPFETSSSRLPRARDEPSERFSGVWLRRAQILLSRGCVVMALGVRVWSPTSRANPFLTPLL